MDKTKKSAESALEQMSDFAAYFYFLKSDNLAAREVRNFFMQRYQLVEEKTADQSVLEVGLPHVISFSVAKKRATVELRLAIVGNVLLTVVLWSTTGHSGRKIWENYLNEVRNLFAQLTSKGSTILGSSVVMVGDSGLSEKLPDLLPLEPRYVGQLDWGRIFHYPQAAHNKQHLYVLEVLDKSSIKAISDFLTKGLIEIDWPIHRLLRELSYYDDQRRTIEQEKKEIDRSVNDILHRKTMTRKPSNEQIEALEEEIGKLSKMYGFLATDLHLVKESAVNLKQDIGQMARAIANNYFQNHNQNMAFPGVYEQKFAQKLTLMQDNEADLRLSLDSVKAAIEVVRTQVELFRGGEEMVIQEQTKEILKQNTALQVAAQGIELVLVFYYTIKSWEAVAVPYKVEDLSPWLKFGIVGFFSVMMVVLTHQVAKSIERRQLFHYGLVLSLLGVLAALVAMIFTPVLIEP